MLLHLLAIGCNRCQATCPGSISRREKTAREAAKRAGWNKRNGTRLCPTCRNQPAGTTPAELEGAAV